LATDIDASRPSGEQKIESLTSPENPLRLFTFIVE
jgi:hypothetical protein